MTLSELCIRRPVMTTLMMAALLLFGIIGYRSLPVSELPNVDFPTINVSARLPGADPETMASAVATVLENNFSTIAGIESMTSTNTQGSTNITLQFSLDRNIDSAAQDVQAQISQSLRRLPSDMNDPPSFRKVNPAAFPIMFLALASDTLPLQTVNDYAENLLAQRISTIDGVAEVSVQGAQKRAVRIQVDPDAMTAHNIGIDEAVRAIASANVNNPTGTLQGTYQQLQIKTRGQLFNIAEFGDIIVTYRNGAPVRLSQFAKVIDGVENDKNASWMNNSRAIVLSVQRQPGTNTIAVIDAIKKVLPQFEAQLPPSISLHVVSDRSQSIRNSIHEVQFTLVLAAALVVLVIFLFLRNVSSTLVPSLALPLSIVGTFGIMAMLGYSIDNLSLMALTLAVGFVVDDAIVVLENIVRHMERGETPFEAAIKGSREIAFTVLSMTASLCAVFIPALFMDGIVGRLLHQFAVTVVAAIVVSGFVSLTLTPMMASRFVRAPQDENHGWIYRFAEACFDGLLAAYRISLDWCLAHQRTVLVVFFATFAAAYHVYTISPKGFIPSEDTGQFTAFTEAGTDASFTDMVTHQEKVRQLITQDPNVKTVMSSVGAGGARGGASSGFMLIVLKPRSERSLSSDQVISELRPKLQRIPGINVFMNNPPAIRIGGRQSKAPYQYTLQDLDLNELFATASRMTDAIRADPAFVDVTNDADVATPTVSVSINRNKASVFGVSAEQIQSALASAFGNRQVSTIYTQAAQYSVILQVPPGFSKDIADLAHLYVRSSSGPLIPLINVVDVGHGIGPLSINHQGQLPSVTISFGLTPGMAIGTAVDRVRQIEREVRLPATVTSSFQGTARAFEASLQNMGILILLAVVVVYIILGILYESFIHPLTILSGLPSAALGALLTLWMFNMELSLYAFVGMIMLVGIVKKNAIMMIDFALARQREERISPQEAIREACLIRFRPIMMTTMAALMGTLPIALAAGAGSEARQPLGMAVVGGLVLSQLLTLYLTPVIYIYLARISGAFDSKSAATPAEPVTVAGE